MSRFICFALCSWLIYAPTLLRAVEIPEPKDLPDVLNLELEAPWDKLTTGGGGRYLVFHLPSIKKLALFDVGAGDVIKTIDAPGEDLMLAAGLEKLLVLVPSQNIVHRYAIATVKREKSFPTPANFKPKIFIMGSESNGPVVTYSAPPVTMYSLETFKPMTYKGDVLQQGASTFGNFGYDLTISADGETVVGWTPGISGQHYFVMKLLGNYAVQLRSPEGYSHGGRYLRPNPNASLYFQDSMHIWGPNLKPLAADHFKDNVIYACDDPRYFLALEKSNKDEREWRNVNAWICASGTLQKIALVKDVGDISNGHLHSEQGRWKYEPRVRYYPTANVVVSLMSEGDKIRVIRANLSEMLAEQNPDGYLHIISSPNRMAWLGQSYSYQIETLNSDPKITYKVESGPSGLKVSPGGEVTWQPSKRPEGGVAKVVIVASDSKDNERFHSFDLFVERPVGNVAAGSTRPRPGAPEDPKSTPDGSQSFDEMPSPPPLQAKAPTKIDDHRLEIAGSSYQLSPGLEQKSMLLLQNELVTPLAADGITPEASVRFKKPYLRVGERAAHWVAVGKDPIRVDIIQKKTLNVLRSIEFTAIQIEDLALHPTQPLCYVAYKADVDVPRYRLVAIHEIKGEVIDSPDFIGNCLAVDPAGKFLMAGYRDIYEKGANLIFNPDRIHVVPEYGSIDWLIRYDLSKGGLPEKIDIKAKAGGNGRGIRLSADGQRVTYLSVVGSPSQSKNLAAWRPKRLDDAPVAYSTKGIASTEFLAFHPFLPLVACLDPANGNVVMFERESGEKAEAKLVWPDEGLGATTKAHNLHFSPDGRRLVLETSVNDVRYLRAFDLKLLPSEVTIIENGVKNLGVPKLASKATAPLAQIDALAGGLGKPMTAKEIGRWFMDSVVVVQNGNSTGTGFLVGSDGFILTCAHCVDNDDDAIDVIYRVQKNGGVKTGKVVAQLVNRDDERDLALIKITKVPDLRPVRLGDGKALESGDRLYVIGNPGLGDASTILDYTMTEGIVSNPKRLLLGNYYVQTTAQINPGSSGGPVFNDRGMVVGLVAAKGTQLEGAGFAVPGQDVVAFLVKSTLKSAANLQLRREWVDSTGERTIDATLLAITDDSVQLRKADGAEISVPHARLSSFDRDFLKLFRP